MSTEAYQPILAILDEGLWLYRRHFVRFALIAALWLVPIAIVGSLVAVTISWSEGTTSTLMRLVVGMVLIVAMLVYSIGGLSHAAVAAATGQQVRLHMAWAIRPLRIIETSAAAVVLGLFAQLIYGILSLTFLALAPFIGIFAMATAQFASVWSLFVIMFGGIVLTVAVGMPISTLIYVLQPWFFESQSWRQTFARSSGLVLGDIGACFLTTMLWVTICLNIGTIVWRLPPDLGSPVGRVALIFAAIVIAILLFPPLPIWMALLYYRETSAYSGADLAARIAEWQRQDTAPGIFGDLHANGIPSTMPPAESQNVD
jgi:hypothetical protein